MHSRTLHIGDRPVGPGAPCFLIAEAGVNHNGQLDLACALVDAAAAAGVDAVKFQTFRAEELATPDAPKAAYQEAAVLRESHLEMLRWLELDPKDHRALSDHCRTRGVRFLSSPFDSESADLLADLGVEAYKVGSGELTNHPLLAHLARRGLPILLSTGMANLGEVEAALQTIEANGAPDVALLHCVSAYPAVAEDANLRAMHTLATAFGLPTGYSDHTKGIEVALAAVALGAVLLEKHLTMDRTLDGPDHAASLEPDELAAMVRSVRAVEVALGDGRKRPAAVERECADAARRSLVAAQDLPEGTVLTAPLIALRRPGTGLPPALLPHVLWRTLRVDVRQGDLLTLEMLA